MYDAAIIGVLIMYDEKGLDEKMLCVLQEDYERIQDISDLSESDRHDIHWFFSNYKSNTPGKWSIVKGYENRDCAVKLLNKSIISN